MKTIALYSINGGIGKTAACGNLAYLAARVNLMNAYIPCNAEVEQMGYHRASLSHYGPTASGAAAVANLWQEIRNPKLEEHGDGLGD